MILIRIFCQISPDGGSCFFFWAASQPKKSVLWGQLFFYVIKLIAWRSPHVMWRQERERDLPRTDSRFYVSPSMTSAQAFRSGAKNVRIITVPNLYLRLIQMSICYKQHTHIRHNY